MDISVSVVIPAYNPAPKLSSSDQSCDMQLHELASTLPSGAGESLRNTRIRASAGPPPTARSSTTNSFGARDRGARGFAAIIPSTNRPTGFCPWSWWFQVRSWGRPSAVLAPQC
jgi:hypothetical protein